MRHYREAINQVARTMYNRWLSGASVIHPEGHFLIAYIYNKKTEDVYKAIMDAFETKKASAR
jgi:hypothetical protein